MSLNLGTEAFGAVQRLKNNSDWRTVVEALTVLQSDLMHRAIEGPQDTRADVTGYARAIRDLVSHIMLVEQPQPGNRNVKAPVRSREALNV